MAPLTTLSGAFRIPEQNNAPKPSLTSAASTNSGSPNASPNATNPTLLAPGSAHSQAVPNQEPDGRDDHEYEHDSDGLGPRYEIHSAIGAFTVDTSETHERTASASGLVVLQVARAGAHDAAHPQRGRGEHRKGHANSSERAHRAEQPDELPVFLLAPQLRVHGPGMRLPTCVSASARVGDGALDGVRLCVGELGWRLRGVIPASGWFRVGQRTFQFSGALLGVLLVHQKMVAPRGQRCMNSHTASATTWSPASPPHVRDRL